MPRRAPGSDDFLNNSHVPDPLSEVLAVDGIPVAEQVSWRILIWKRFSNLLGRPFGGRISRYVEVGDAALVMPQDHKAIQHAERGRRYSEEVDGSNLTGVIFQEGPPGLRRRLGMADYVFGDGRFGDRVAE